MSNDLHTVDPDWAWQVYEPTATRPWDRRRAAHLHRRAGFGAHDEQLDATLATSPSDAVARIVRPPAAPDFDRQMTELTSAALAGGEAASLGATWLYRMLLSPHPLLENMTLFWHGHFATSADKVQDAKLMQAQNELFRRHALGRFPPLVQAVSRDPAMLVYLDSATNRKSHPNENFARELMELFCLGEGNYTEQDVLEVARCFTGWQVRRGKFRFNRYHHDFGSKQFLGRSGEFDGGDAVDVVLEQNAAPRFVVRKLFRFFVCDAPEPTDQLLEPLAAYYRETEMDSERLVKRILSSNLFFSEAAIGRKIRSPVAFAIGLLRSLQGTTNVNDLSEQLSELGQQLFYPPNVKGWDGGRTWINSSTLLGRANLVSELLSHEATRFARGSLEELAARHGKLDGPDCVDWLSSLLLAVPLPAQVRRSLVDLMDGAPEREEGLAKTLHAMCALPEYQLG